MSRSGYSDGELDNWSMIKWRGMVASATRGKRGQAMLKALLEALDAMPEKKLITDNLEDQTGQVCAIGALGRARGLDMSQIDPYDYDQVARAFDVAPCLAQEIVFLNDESYVREDHEQRWRRMRNWVASQLKE